MNRGRGQTEVIRSLWEKKVIKNNQINLPEQSEVDDERGDEDPHVDDEFIGEFGALGLCPDAEESDESMVGS
jgi:hypothetical protein